MDEIEDNLQRASASLAALADGPAVQAADALEQAFQRAGQTIEQTLSQAARSGELDFRRMTEAILADLARLAAEAVIGQTGFGAAKQTVNVNVPTSLTSPRSNSAQLVSLIANAAVRGARYA